MDDTARTNNKVCRWRLLASELEDRLSPLLCGHAPHALIGACITCCFVDGLWFTWCSKPQHGATMSIFIYFVTIAKDYMNSPAEESRMCLACVPSVMLLIPLAFSSLCPTPGPTQPLLFCWLILIVIVPGFIHKYIYTYKYFFSLIQNVWMFSQFKHY